MDDRKTIMTLRRLKNCDEDIEVLQQILKESPTYHLRISGSVAKEDDARQMLLALPKEKTLEDKFCVGIFLSDVMIGCADVIRGYPKFDIAWIGLLLLSEKYQNQKLGIKSYDLLEKLVMNWPEIQSIRLSVVRTNDDVIPFWNKVGFKPTGDVRPFSEGVVNSELVIFEKLLYSN